MVFSLMVFTTIKGVAATAETVETRKRAQDTNRNTGLIYRELLDALLLVVNRPSREGRQAWLSSPGRLVTPSRRSCSQLRSSKVSW